VKLTADVVAVAIVDAEGRPVEGLALEGVLGRTVTAAADQRLAFKEVEPGRFRAPAAPLKGSLRLELAAYRGDVRVYVREHHFMGAGR